MTLGRPLGIAAPLAALLAAACDCGSGVQTARPGIRVVPASIDFGGVALGDSSEQRVEVHSTGLVGLSVRDIALDRSDDASMRVSGALDMDCRGVSRAPAEPVAAGQCAVVSVTFAPDRTGLFQNVLRIPSDDPANAVVEVELVGEGLAPAAVACVDSGTGGGTECSRSDDAPPFMPVLDFGEIPRRTAALRTLHVRNTGGAPLRILSAEVASGVAAFALVGEAPAQIEAQQAGDVVAKFAPPDAGRFGGMLRLRTNDPSRPVLEVPLRGTGLGPSPTLCVVAADGSVPEASCSRLGEAPPFVPALDFGAVERRSSATRKLRIRNDGRAELQVLAVARTGSDVFSLDDVSALLGPGAFVDVPVRFSPPARGRFEGGVRVANDDSDHPEIASVLLGTGTAPSIRVCVPTDAGTVDESRCSRLDEVPPFIPTVALGSVLPGTRVTHPLRILDAGDAPLSVSAVSVPAGAPVVEASSPGIPGVVVPAGFLDVAVGAAPTAQGPVAGIVRIASDDDGHPYVDVPVSASGVAPELVVCVLRDDGSEDPNACSRLRWSPPYVPTLDFGTLAWGRRSVRSIRLRNAGLAPLSLPAPVLGASTAGFSLGSGAAAGTLAAAAIRDLEVVFAPVTDGRVSAQLHVRSDDPVSPDVAIALLGFGDGQKLCASPATLDFGTVRVGMDATRTVTVTNCGGVPVTVTAFAFAGSPVFSAVFPAVPLPLAVSAHADVSVRFTPTTQGAVSGSITATTARGSLAVPVKGTGGAPTCESLLGSAACQDTGSRTVPTNPQCHLKIHLPFATTREWRWPGTQTLPSGLGDYTRVMMTPVVADVDRDGHPEAAFVAYRPPNAAEHALVDAAIPYYQGPGALVLVDGRNGTTRWMQGPESSATPEVRLASSSQIAVGDLDNAPDGKLEIAAIRDWLSADDTYNGGPAVFASDGRMLWSCRQTGNCLSYAPLHSTNVDWGGPSLADLDHDGIPEIVYGATVYKRQSNGTYALVWNKNTGTQVRPTGGTLGSGDNGVGPLSVVADVDQDGTPEILTGRTMYRADGSTVWNAGQGALASDPNVRDGFPALADFDGDGAPEIVVVTSVIVAGEVKGQVLLRRLDGRTMRGPVELPSADGHPGRGGPPTIADFDGDGRPEIGVASKNRYSVFDTDLSVLWSRPVQDYSSSSTGSSVFDFEGDGFAEVVYGDEQKLHVFDGATGEVLFEQPNTSATAYESPVVADVDGDGQAEIVVASNPYSCGSGCSSGVTVWGGSSPTWNWVGTRSLWNQHAYFVANVHDSGDVTSPIPASWSPGTLDGWPMGGAGGTFRANAARAPAGAWQALTSLQLDTVDVDPSECPDVTVRFWLDNRGLAPVPAGETASLYRGTSPSASRLLDRRTIAQQLPPGASIRIALHASGVAPGGNMTLVVDPGSVQQCTLGGNGDSMTIVSPCR